MDKKTDRASSDAMVHGGGADLARLVEIMRRLRDPKDGCPWDIEQDFASIAPYTIEEAYEVADAIERGAMDELRGELGDLLLQTVYHSQMAEEAGAFTFADVTQGISDKMVRRHPHVFGDEDRDKSAAQQTRDWEALKAKERGARVSALDGVAAGLPAFTRAIKLQNRAARVGFDWPDMGGVIDKVVEEAKELQEAHARGDVSDIEDEFGDLAFVLANLARHLQIDPEAALRRTNAKFTRRFKSVEAALARDGRRPEDSNLAEMDVLWDRAKAEESGGNSS